MNKWIYDRGVKFDGKKLKIFFYLKREELGKTSKNFAKYVGIPQMTLYSCIFNGSMERENYKKLENKFWNDEEFKKIFEK